MSLIRSPRPFAATTSLALAAIQGVCSQLATHFAPARAAIIARRPAPVPISRTDRPGATRRIASSYAEFRGTSFIIAKCQGGTAFSSAASRLMREFS
jgi:hypothetical protein